LVIENRFLKQTIVAKSGGQEIEYQEIETIIHQEIEIIAKFQEIERPMGLGKVRLGVRIDKVRLIG
jgi:hypothetical protein